MISTLHIWAFRDVLRRPLESLLLAAALTLTIAIVGTLLLLPRAVYDTVDKLLDAAPSVVVRRVDAAGWRPLPVREALEAVRGVIGVVASRPRVWAAATGPDGPVTVLGMEHGVLPEGISDHLTEFPDRGRAIVGPGVAPALLTEGITLKGSIRRTYRVIGRLPDESSMFTNDLVVLNIADARELIGLPEGYASDLAVDVFHADEETAILPDLTAAFPWPVRCVTRNESAGIYATGFNRDSAIGAVAAVPAVLAICLLMAVSVRKSMGRQAELGLMKAMGWTTADIVRLQMLRALSVCLPSAVAGICLSYLMVYWPGATWVGRIFFGWQTVPPMLYLEPGNSAAVLLEVAGIVLVPVIGSALAPAVKGATTEAHELMEGTGGR